MGPQRARATPRAAEDGLVAGLRRGDPAALEALYRRFGQRVYRLARGMLPQDSDAEDATQEVFLRVRQRAAQFDGRARFTTWLHRLTIHHCLHRIERERVRRTDALDADQPARDGDPGDAAAREDERARLGALLQRLTPEHRAVLVLRELEELPYADIAAVLDLPVGTVMSRLARARERLLHLAGTRAGAPAFPETRTP